MIIKTYGASLMGIDATTITVEVNIVSGINFFLVGLPDPAVKESHQRIKASFANNDLRFPGKEITINLAPADMRKEGSMFDLPIAVGILAASEQLPNESLLGTMLVGELSLDGELKPLKGALSIATNAKNNGFTQLILPSTNANEAALVEGIDIIPARNIMEVIKHLNGSTAIPAFKSKQDWTKRTKSDLQPDFSEVKGQFSVKRAFEIAAAGGHNIVLIGPPGAGKSMLAKRFSTILPPLTIEEAIETTRIHSVAGKVDSADGLVRDRPFRKPHHTISDVALVGGGSYPQPGEISLAHNGVLFLDELPEYKRTVLEVMRQPLEDRVVTISRARFSVDYPAGVILVAAMNPCPCGYFNHPTRECSCSSFAVQRYLNRVSGPLLDRIDLHIEVTPVDFNDLSCTMEQEGSETIRTRVIEARKIQGQRYDRSMVLAEDREEAAPIKAIPDSFHGAVRSNAEMLPKHLRRYCQLDKQSNDLLKKAMNTLGLSARAYDRILKVARTIADLDGSEDVKSKHVAEAIQYRSLDRENWGG